MNIAHVFLVILLFFWGFTLLGLVAVSNTVLGILALLTAVAFLVSLFTPVVIPLRRSNVQS